MLTHFKIKLPGKFTPVVPVYLRLDRNKNYTIILELCHSPDIIADCIATKEHIVSYQSIP